MRFSCITSRSVWADHVTSKSPWMDQKPPLASASYLDSLPVRREVLHWENRSLRSVPALEWVPGICSLFLTILQYRRHMGIWIHLLFGWSILLLRWFFWDKFLMHPYLPILQCLLSEYLLSKFSPRSMHIPKIFLERLSYQIDEVLLGLVLKSDGTRALLQTELLDLWMVLGIVFHRQLPSARRSWTFRRWQ